MYIVTYVFVSMVINPLRKLILIYRNKMRMRELCCVLCIRLHSYYKFVIYF